MEMKIVKIRELGPDLIKGVNFDKEDASMAKKSGYMPLLRANNITDMNINFDEMMYVDSSVVKSEQYLQDGDIIFVTSSGSKRLVGKSALVLNLPESATIGAFNSLLRFPKSIDSRYIFYTLNSPLFAAHITKRLVGVNINNIKKDDILDFEFSIPFKNGKPDLVGQKGIADELAEMFTLKQMSISDIHKTDAVIGSVSRTQFKNGNEAYSVKLSEICNITKGTSPTLKTKPGKYPLVVTSAERRSADTYQIDDEAVCIPLVSSTGHGHASLHRIHYQQGQFALANIMVALTAKDKNEVDIKYLYYYLSYYRNELLVPLMRGVANVTIPYKSLNQVVIHLPDIEKQRRVVAIFNDIETLKNKLLDRHVLINRLVPSMMNQLFTIKV